MKTTFTQSLCLLGMLVFLGSCASSYKPIMPENINYTAKTELNQVLLEYKYDVLLERGNKKYAKREKKKFVQVAAVKITNYSDESVTIGENASFIAGNNHFTPLNPNITHSQLKQGVPIYLLYLLMSDLQLFTEQSVNGTTTKKSFPIGIVLGPGLTAFNMIKAGSANQNFLAEMQRYQLQNRKILPGETVYGLISIPNSSYNPLYLKKSEGMQVLR